MREGGGCSIKMTGVILIPFRGEICELVPLRVLKPKITTARVVTVLFRAFNVIDLKNDEDCNRICHTN